MKTITMDLRKNRNHFSFFTIVKEQDGFSVIKGGTGVHTFILRKSRTAAAIKREITQWIFANLKL